MRVRPIGYYAFHTNNIFVARKIEFMGTGFEITGLLDFDFVTEKLGTLRCRWAKNVFMGRRGKTEKMAR